MANQLTHHGLLRLSALLSSAFVLFAISAPAFADGSSLFFLGGLNPTPKGMHLAQMGEMGGKMTGAPTGNDSKPGGMAGGMGDKMPCCMGMMGAAPGAGTAMAMPSALPGFPGASHLYHVGSTGFFLDYAEKIGLSVEQKTALNAIKQRSLSDQSGTERKIAEAEQGLWALTAAEQPDAAAIDSKVREIEKLKSDQRLAFIRSVGEAGKLLTGEQRKMVLGMVAMPPDAAMPNMK
jgi:Spy/CpxP family protein refolding chaperone